MRSVGSDQKFKSFCPTMVVLIEHRIALKTPWKTLKNVIRHKYCDFV